MRRGWTIIELLVVIGVVCILIGLLLPALGGARAAGRNVVTLSNISQLGSMVVQYAADNRELPPVIFQPIVTLRNWDAQRVRMGELTVKGHWFNNADFYFLCFDQAPSLGTLRDGGRASEGVPIAGTVPVSDFSIAHCFYADPTYWDGRTQMGASQFGAQRISSVNFPSEKGFLKQVKVRSNQGEQPACCLDSVMSAVLWGDSSASVVDQSRLVPGEPNFYYHGSAVQTYWSRGLPIDWTLHGVRGVDRPKN